MKQQWSGSRVEVTAGSHEGRRSPGDAHSSREHRRLGDREAGGRQAAGGRLRDQYLATRATQFEPDGRIPL